MMTKKIEVNKIVLCALFAALIAVGAFIKIPIPFVPFTMQVLFTTLAGLILGAKYGTISVLVYIVLGLLGFPIFTQGGGIGYIFQPTFGYIIGFAIGAFVTGLISRSGKITFTRLLAASLAGLVIVYTVGMIYYFFIAKYYLNNPIGIKALFYYCCLLFIPGDTLSCVLGAFLAKKIIPIVKK